MDASCSHIFDLPSDLVITALRCLRLTDILRFSEASHSAHGVAGDQCLWEPLFLSRRWSSSAVARAPTNNAEPGAWRAAYRKAARTESPIVEQLTDFRGLAGFARDTAPTPFPGRSIDAALSSIGLVGTSALRGADVILVVNAVDSVDRVEQLLRQLFSRGARRVRCADASLSALRCAGDGDILSGSVLFVDLERITAACVINGQRLPARKREVVGPGLRQCISFLAENTPLSSVQAASGSTVRPDAVGSAVAAAAASSAHGPSSAMIAQATIAAMRGLPRDSSNRARAADADAAAAAAAEPASEWSAFSEALSEAYDSARAPVPPLPPSPEPQPITPRPVEDDEPPALDDLSEPEKFILLGLLGEPEPDAQRKTAQLMRRSGLGDTELAALAQANRERSDADERGPSATRRFDDELRARIARNPPQQQNSSNASSASTAYTSSARESTSGFSTITAVPAHHTSFQQQQQQQSAARVEAAEEVEDLPIIDPMSHELGVDLLWLAQHHCYVRAVSTERRPVSGEEVQMAGCVLKAPSGRKWTLSQQRFMAFEQLFKPPPSLLLPAMMGGGSGGSAAPQSSELAANGFIAGTGLAAAMALSNSPQARSACGKLALSSGGRGSLVNDGPVPGGAVDVLRQTIENLGGRQQLTELFGAIVLAGPGGGLPGLRQRIESELRTIRNDPEMPRTLRPRLVESSAEKGSISGGQYTASSDLLKGGGAEGSASGFSGPNGQAAAASSWALTEAESLAWRGAAADACVSVSSGGVSSGGETWTYADTFKREPRNITRQAMRSAGCSVERWSEVADAALARAVGGHYGGSGIVRNPREHLQFGVD